MPTIEMYGTNRRVPTGIFCEGWRVNCETCCSRNTRSRNDQRSPSVYIAKNTASTTYSQTGVVSTLPVSDVPYGKKTDARPRPVQNTTHTLPIAFTKLGSIIYSLRRRA